MKDISFTPSMSSLSYDMFGQIPPTPFILCQFLAYPNPTPYLDYVIYEYPLIKYGWHQYLMFTRNPISVFKIESHTKAHPMMRSYYVLLLSFIVMEIPHCHPLTLHTLFGHLLGFLQTSITIGRTENGKILWKEIHI